MKQSPEMPGVPHAGNFIETVASQARHIVAVAAFIGSSVLSGMGGVAHAETLASTRPATPYEVTSCINPTQHDLVSVIEKVDEPPRQTPAAGVNTDPYAAANISAKRAYQREVAKKYGLHVHDATPIIHRLEDEDDGTLSYEAYLNSAKTFMAQYGVTLRLASQNEALFYGGRALTYKELQNDTFKKNIINLLEGYSNVPVEYVELSGEKNIILAGGMVANNAVAYAITAGDHDTTVYDATVALDTHTYGHELGHLVDAAECGNATIRNDQAYADLHGDNDHLYRGVTFDTESPNYRDQLQHDGDMYVEAAHAAEVGDTDGACQITEHIDTVDAQVASYSEYHPNTAEAKAEMYAEIWDPSEYHTILDPQYPLIRDQAIELLSRLEAEDPRIAGYFLDVSDRPDSRPQLDCGKGTPAYSHAS